MNTRSRSRSKNNRNRKNNNSGGNVVNRVFDSSGPEGKVRGTPQQIIDKYNQLARDAQLSGDRVATENFQQHAEHYLRMLAAAQREMDARREEQERQNRERQAERDRERQERLDRQEAAAAAEDPSEAPQPDVVAPMADEAEDQQADSGLVETPESKPKPKPRSRTPRKPRPKPKTETDETPAVVSEDASDAAE